MKIVLESRASLEIELPDGSSFIVPPPSRAQVRACLALDCADAAEPANVAEASERNFDRLRVLVLPPDAPWAWALPAWAARLAARLGVPGAHERPPPLESLDPIQVQEVLTAVITSYFGGDPADALAMQRTLKKKAILDSLNGSNSLIATPASSPSSSASTSAPSSESASPKVS